MIAGIAVDLEDAVESFENAFGIVAATPRRVVIDHDRWIGAAMAAVVAQNRPEITSLRAAAAGIERGARVSSMNRQPDSFMSALMRSTSGARWKATVPIQSARTAQSSRIPCRAKTCDWR